MFRFFAILLPGIFEDAFYESGGLFRVLCATKNVCSFHFRKIVKKFCSFVEKAFEKQYLLGQEERLEKKFFFRELGCFFPDIDWNNFELLYEIFPLDPKESVEETIEFCSRFFLRF